MRFGFKLSHLPLRLATGAYLLNSGLAKSSLPEEQTKQLYEWAAGGFPPVRQVSPSLFGRVLAYGEMAVGAALLLPFVSAGAAGAALGAFSGAALALYVKTPSLRQDGSLRPSDEGIMVAKDTWMAGIAASLIMDDFARRLRQGRRGRSARRRSK
jgi:uncharacterized membrane protein YphA (DoxX/SURF4 family)